VFAWLNLIKIVFVLFLLHVFCFIFYRSIFQNDTKPETKTTETNTDAIIAVQKTSVYTQTNLVDKTNDLENELNVLKTVVKEMKDESGYIFFSINKNCIEVEINNISIAQKRESLKYAPPASIIDKQN
jgi:hypothetical protein